MLKCCEWRLRGEVNDLVRWEYRHMRILVDADCLNTESLEAELDKMGDIGWELCGLRAGGGYGNWDGLFECIFKRPKNEGGEA